MMAGGAIHQDEEPRRKRVLKTRSLALDPLSGSFSDLLLWLMVVTKLECPILIFSHQIVTVFLLVGVFEAVKQLRKCISDTVI